MRGLWEQLRLDFGTLGKIVKGGAPGSNPIGQAHLDREQKIHSIFHSMFGAPAGDGLKAAGKAIGRGSVTLGKGLIGTPGGRGVLAAGALVAGLGMYVHRHPRGENMQSDVNRMAAGAYVGATAGLFGKKGMYTAVTGMGMGAIAGAVSLGMSAEFAARTVLTGNPLLIGKGRTPVRGALDAWFPNIRNLPLKDAEGALNLSKFAVNPSVIRRMVGIGMIAGAAAGAASIFHTPAPAATIYWDGQQMRRMGDLGANGGYAQRVLGPNSTVNMQMGYEDIAQRMVHFL